MLLTAEVHGAHDYFRSIFEGEKISFDERLTLMLSTLMQRVDVLAEGAQNFSEETLRKILFSNPILTINSLIPEHIKDLDLSLRDFFASLLMFSRFGNPVNMENIEGDNHQHSFDKVIVVWNTLGEKVENAEVVVEMYLNELQRMLEPYAKLIITHIAERGDKIAILQKTITGDESALQMTQNMDPRGPVAENNILEAKSGLTARLITMRDKLSRLKEEQRFWTGFLSLFRRDNWNLGSFSLSHNMVANSQEPIPVTA